MIRVTIDDNLRIETPDGGVTFVTVRQLLVEHRLHRELVAACEMAESELCAATFAKGADQRSLKYAIGKLRAIGAKVKELSHAKETA